MAATEAMQSTEGTMRYAVIILIAAAALVGAAPAFAHGLVSHPRCSSMQCREASQKQNLAHARYLCNYGRHETKHWGCHAVKWLKQELNKTEAVLHPRVTASSHWAGWSCITNGAGPKAPHEGNGYNGRYTGRLGMTTPWAGHYPSTGDWVTAPITEVYGYAEQEAAKHHWNYSWMQGQWPNTFPPCAGYFN